MDGPETLAFRREGEPTGLQFRANLPYVFIEFHRGNVALKALR